jgi:hypothetical protein
MKHFTSRNKKKLNIKDETKEKKFTSNCRKVISRECESKAKEKKEKKKKKEKRGEKQEKKVREKIKKAIGAFLFSPNTNVGLWWLQIATFFFFLT